MSDKTPSSPHSAPKRPVPAGFKVVIGCLVAFFGLAVISVVVLGLGGLWLKDKAGDVVQSVQARVDAQQEAAAILDRLQRNYTFTAPRDGRIDPESTDRFARVVDVAWSSLEVTLRRLEETSDRARDGQADLGDMIEGIRAGSVLVDSRLHIARALEEAGMSLDEFVWTGAALRDVWRQVNADGASSAGNATDPVARSNIALAERHKGLLEVMERGGADVNPAAVLDLAVMWASANPGVRSPPR